jgi:uncharacterized repeat protein (TIGR01451 family)
MSSLTKSTSCIAGASRARVRKTGTAAFAAAVVVLIVVLAPGSALAITPSPRWTVTAYSEPTNLAPAAGSTGTYRVEVKNTGGAASDGSPITIADVLPSGLKVASPAFGLDQLSGGGMSCTGVSCEYAGIVVPDDSLSVTIPVEVASGAQSSVTNIVRVSGGGAPEATRETPTAISSTPTGFGIAPGSVATALSSTQAGAHPDVTVALAFNTIKEDLTAGDAKEVVGDLPPGFVGDLADTPRCPIADFSKEAACRPGTQVGTTTLTFVASIGGRVLFRFTAPVYNLTTNPGEIAKLGFYPVSGIQGSVSLRPGDYGVRTTFQNINENLSQLDSVSLTVWGVPSEASHDPLRGVYCATTKFGGGCSAAIGQSQSLVIPYLTNPTECMAAPSHIEVSTTSWQDPGQRLRAPAERETEIGPMTGCNLLEFGPSITAAPDTTHADTPAGFTFNVKMPQEGLVSAGGLSSADIESTTATLPEGVVINPGQAAGLGACQFSQDGVGVDGPPSCPSDSKVGEVEVESPLIKRLLKGQVYLLQSNPPNVKLLVAPEDPADGIYVKFIGTVHLNEATGQLVTTFEKTPELPFNNLRLSFSGGAQAALVTPTGCGTYMTIAGFAPWSGEAEAVTASSFAIDSGPGSSACISPLPFSPGLIAGATTDQAGGFTDFSLLLQRADGQQRVSSLQFKVPEGLLGMISKIPLCSEPQASQGTCSSASQIGHTVVEAGPGPYPLVVPQPGSPPAPIYLTGGYKGAPYGLSIVVPLVVGPFNLGTIVVRSRIEVDSLTAQLTVTTDPLPTIIAGVPADLRTINAVIDRPGFMFNPTSCAPMAFGGTATSMEGTTTVISSHFQVGSCQSLKFKPDFRVSTSGKTSRANGASLDAKIVYPSGVLPNNQASSQSNIKSVKVDLPKQLPSRLTTLQKACPDSVFNQNPAVCPAASRVGEASAITPVLPVGLSGPAYFVSHGGAKFPELVVLLSGYGTTVQIHGETFISPAGITSSTFRNVPDVPITSFELKLPQGPNSALAANGNLCATKLKMPTAFTAQNGAVIHQSTPIAVTGCAKHKLHKKSKHKKK